MSTTTTNYGFTLPAIADPIDEDLWGSELNTNFTSLDTILGARTASKYGAIIVQNATDNGFDTITSQGTAGQVLTSNGADALPSFQSFYPIGSVYINATVATNPAILLGFGTWTAFGAGRVPVGIDVSDPTFDTAGETVGSKDAVVVSHTHTVNDPGHDHGFDQGAYPDTFNNTTYYPSDTIGTATGKWLDTTGISINSAGVSGTNANIQPSIVVYMWKRTA